MLGMQGADWGAPQIHPYSHGPLMQPQGSPWAVMGPPAQDNLFARSAASRRFFSESVEYTAEVRDTRAATHADAPCYYLATFS